MVALNDPIRRLRRMLEYTPHPDVNQMLRDRNHVLRRYGDLFSPSGVAAITADEFAGFLLFENNRHWWGLQRGSARMTNNMDVLRWALSVLLDDSSTIEARIDEIDPPGAEPAVPGFEHDVYTPILLMSGPERYGVWNAISESAMKRLELWPDLSEAGSNGSRYREINEMILTVATELDTDPWTLDAMWWAVEKEHDPSSHFVTRKHSPAAPRTSSASRTAPRKAARTRRPAKPKPTTFVCTNCFQQKPLNLASDDPNLCVDCA